MNILTFISKALKRDRTGNAPASYKGSKTLVPMTTKEAAACATLLEVMRHTSMHSLMKTWEASSNSHLPLETMTGVNAVITCLWHYTRKTPYSAEAKVLLQWIGNNNPAIDEFIEQAAIEQDSPYQRSKRLARSNADLVVTFGTKATPPEPMPAAASIIIFLKAGEALHRAQMKTNAKIAYG